MSHPRLRYLFPRTEVVRIDPNRALVFAIYGGPEDAPPSGAWSFVLDRIDDSSTRLFARLQLNPPPLIGKLLIYGFMEPAHFVMQDGMFRGLKERIQSEMSRPQGPSGEATDGNVGVGAGRVDPLRDRGPAAASGE